MSQVFKDEMTYLTSNDEIEFMIQAEFLTESTQTMEHETQVFSICISDDESIEDAEKDMVRLTKNSLKDWKE